MEKEVAISILEDIENSLQKENWKENSLRTINQYEKGLKVATNKKIQKLIEKQKVLIEKKGKNSKEIIKINKKIDEGIRKIFNN